MVGTDKVQSIRGLAGQMGFSEDTPEEPPHPAPKEATLLYPLGTAEVDALVGATADHWERLRAGGEEDDRGIRWLDGITDSMDMGLGLPPGLEPAEVAAL